MNSLDYGRGESAVQFSRQESEKEALELKVFRGQVAGFIKEQNDLANEYRQAAAKTRESVDLMLAGGFCQNCLVAKGVLEAATRKRIVPSEEISSIVWGIVSELNSKRVDISYLASGAAVGGRGSGEIMQLSMAAKTCIEDYFSQLESRRKSV